MSNWIKFKTGVQPVPDGVTVTIKTADGDTETANAECFSWEIGGYKSDIVAYRVEVDNMSNPIFTPEEIADIARLKRDNNWTHQELAAYLQGKPMNNQDKSAFPVVSYMQPQGMGASIMEIKGGMSLREYAAIKLRVPDSGTDWLDAMIEKSLLNEFAGKALQGFIACHSGADVQIPLTHIAAQEAYEYGNAMLKASKGE